MSHTSPPSNSTPPAAAAGTHPRALPCGRAGAAAEARSVAMPGSDAAVPSGGFEGVLAAGSYACVDASAKPAAGFESRRVRGLLPKASASASTAAPADGNRRAGSRWMHSSNQPSNAGGSDARTFCWRSRTLGASSGKVRISANSDCTFAEGWFAERQ